MSFRNTIVKNVLPLGAIVFLLMSCRVTQPYQRPSAPDHGLYRDTLVKTGKDTLQNTDAPTIASVPWREMFADTILQNLIQQGIDHNLDLKTAYARILEAQANFRQSTLQFFPSLTANGQVRKVSLTAQNVRTYEAYLASSWDISLFGRLQSARRAQLALLLKSVAYQKAVQTELVGSIATYYYSLLAYDQQLKISLATVANRKEDVTTTQALMDADVLTGAAVMQSQANVYIAEVTIPDIRQNIRQTENALSILLARDPGPIARDSLDDQTVRTDLSIGVPAQLLANRPDVQEAEFQFRNAAELTNVARAYFYPDITITAQGGLAGSRLPDIINAPTVFMSLIAGLTQPIFNNGINRQRLEVAKAQQAESYYAFRQSLLTAGKEVSDALYSYKAANDKIRIRAMEIHFLNKSVEFTKELMKYNSNTNYTDVLTSEQNLLAAELNGVNDKLQRLQAIVTLYSSLGGGWK
jgi:multidrug efflux system outer membrane protein